MMYLLTLVMCAALYRVITMMAVLQHEFRR